MRTRPPGRGLVERLPQFCALVFLALGCLLAEYRLRPWPEPRIVLVVPLYAGKTLEYGWVEWPGFLGSRTWSYSSIVRIRSGEGKSAAFIAKDGGDPVKNVAVRATPDRREVWIVETGGSEPDVLAYLNVDTGYFLDRNGMQKDGRLPLTRQLHHDGYQRDYPPHIRPNGGVLLGSTD